MKIVHVNSLYAPFQVGGAEKSVQILAEAQAALGNEVTVLATAPDGVARQDRLNDVDIHYLPVRNIYLPFDGQPHGPVAKVLWHVVDTRNPWMAAALGRKFDELMPEVIHSHTISGFSTSAWRAAHRRRIPRIHTLRDYYLACPRSTMYREGRNCERPCGGCAPFATPRRRASALVDAVVGNSRFILERHLSLGYFPNARLREVIHGGQPTRNDGTSQRAETKAGKPPVFGYIGQINDTKGVSLLINAVRTIGPDARLRIAGRVEGEYAERLRREAPEWVEWLGWQKPADFYRNVDVVVVPSLWHEPLPRTVIEAANAGCRVIGSNRGGTPEVLAMVGGTVFDPDVPGALVHALRQELSFIADSSPAIAADASIISAAFDPQTRARDYLSAYWSLRK